MEASKGEQQNLLTFDIYNRFLFKYTEYSNKELTMSPIEKSGMVSFELNGRQFLAQMDDSDIEGVLQVFDAETGEEVLDLYIVSCGYEEYEVQTALDKAF